MYKRQVIDSRQHRTDPFFPYRRITIDLVQINILRPGQRIGNIQLVAVQRILTGIDIHFDNAVLTAEIIYRQSTETVSYTHLLPALNSNFFDISITSPPYGDNKTTVPYGQFSMLALYTIPPTDLSLEGWELNSFSTIDSKSLGNMSNKMHFSSLEEELLKPYLKQISIAKHSKIKHFFYDYFSFLRDLSRVTKKYIVLTLGNRTVDRVQIDLTGITESYLTQLGFIVLQSASRDITKKRTPKLTSKVDDSPVNSMTKEYVTTVSYTHLCKTTLHSDSFLSIKYNDLIISLENTIALSDEVIAHLDNDQ